MSKKTSKEELLKRLQLILSKFAPKEIELVLDLVTELSAFAADPSKAAEVLQKISLLAKLMAKRRPPDEPKRRPKPKKKGDEE